MKNRTNFIVLQDGVAVSNEFEHKYKDIFSLADFRHRDNDIVTDFVGFVTHNNDVFVSFPKHFYSEIELSQINENTDLKVDIKLLFNCIRKALLKKTLTSIGINEDINKDYPMRSFFQIYEYFQKYGLYYDEIKTLKLGGTGKVNWNKTLKRSPVIVSNGNIIFNPLITNQNQKNAVFVSECMAFAINSTIEKFSFILSYSKIDYDISNLGWENRDLIINKLRTVLTETFKDYQKKLILSLIEFFEHRKSGDKTVRMTINSFNLIWEQILENYLNCYFIGISNDGFLEFSKSKNRILKSFAKGSEMTDKSKNNYKVEPDYYYFGRDYKLILDAKYYDEVKGLNYKQAAYYFLLKHHNMSNAKNWKTHNILLLPTSNSQYEQSNRRTHYKQNTKYNQDEAEFTIKEQYFNIKYLMRRFLE
ncbi:hypothetical protein [Macrococcus armenti]|uniref:hypothetical protein n=1 Tax=Macrococcus armenti TaxID=2875764 RepID=UPI001CCF42B7|nr:hypothetical protein [Macrococcus armenti]UBH08048.1 hypothetical protein LAU41_08430 [Macrococcus armenti]UBH10280.1 hypothetical protein LAU38_08355 [Macrococcus armenti]